MGPSIQESGPSPFPPFHSSFPFVSQSHEPQLFTRVLAQDDLLGSKALDQNSEAFTRRIVALLVEIEECMHELEEALAGLEEVIALINKINCFFGAILVVLCLFKLLKSVELL
ncbi:hypothetical protein QQP08_013313 [Theobroma cacao]|nr:hypothetical protein QQP08_013313 [Theobroma cacao]